MSKAGPKAKADPDAKADAKAKAKGKPDAKGEPKGEAKADKAGAKPTASDTPPLDQIDPQMLQAALHMGLMGQQQPPGQTQMGMMPPTQMPPSGPGGMM